MILSDVIVAIILAVFVGGMVWRGSHKDDKIECENRTGGLVLTKEINSNAWVVPYESPLSVRQNNPINIKAFKANKWEGSIYKRGVFEHFSSPRLGIRASLIVINSNILATDSVEGFVRRIVTKEGKNYLYRYIKFIELRLGYKGKIKKEDKIKVLKAMIFLEGGTVAVEYFNKYLECK